MAVMYKDDDRQKRKEIKRKYNGKGRKEARSKVRKNDSKKEKCACYSGPKTYTSFFFFTVVLCILKLSKSFIYQLMHNSCFKRILKFTLKQLLHVSVHSPSSGSVLFELPKVMVIKIIS